MSPLFCDNENLLDSCSKLFASNLFGDDLSTKIKVRYDDLRFNFNSVTFDEWNKDGEYSLWKFSSGLTPYMDYDDTSIVPIPVSNKLFKPEDAVISFDFPIWFNMENPHSGTILIISQDPLPRNIKWYRDCRDALCTTVFGLHNPLWRNKGNGGKRMWLLVQQLVMNGYGVYLTDCMKFTFQDPDSEILDPTEDQISLYKNTLKAEIETVKPSVIVTMGKTAENVVKNFTTGDIRVLELPHFSGLSQGKIREFFKWSEDRPFTIEEQADAYYKKITDCNND
ncbi:MAG: uracil-DNA glycosylase family protein [Muribaculaceae bacterium]|nr:uracil-DNA glycosylase family protein [Muribaculaceae bacterium]